MPIWTDGSRWIGRDTECTTDAEGNGSEGSKVSENFNENLSWGADRSRDPGGRRGSGRTGASSRHSTRLCGHLYRGCAVRWGGGGEPAQARCRREPQGSGKSAL